MARRKIREYDTKRILAEHFGHYSQGKIKLSFQSILIDPETNIEELSLKYPWLLEQKLVIKPDQLFGKRGKLGLVLLDASFEQVKEYLHSRRNKEVTIGKARDKLTHFIIEPYVAHAKEFYVAILPQRGLDNIIFSDRYGGIDVESHKAEMHIWPVTLGVNTTLAQNNAFLEQSFDRFFDFYDERFAARPGSEKDQAMSSEEKEKIKLFLKTLYHLFLELEFTYLELNPFTIMPNGEISILGAVASVDGCALFQQEKRWQLDSFPTPFGRRISPEENYITELNEKSGGSLKLTVLNPQGRIWNIFSGGGASVILLDSLVACGAGQEIANYGEYSGNPTREESYHYAKTILDLMTREKNLQGKILLIGGAIANFTDVEKTFQGIADALIEQGDKLKEQAISMHVRRGGPNYKKGLELIKQAGEKIGISCNVYGPETEMTFIAALAGENVRR